MGLMELAEQTSAVGGAQALGSLLEKTSNELRERLVTNLERRTASLVPRCGKRGVKTPRRETMADIIQKKDLKQTAGGEFPEFQVKEADRKITDYDFKHPARVNKAQLRIFEMLHDNFARLLSYTFSRLLRSPVEVKTAFIDQTTYREAMESLSNPSCTYQFRMRPCKGHAFVDFELPLVFGYLDKRFGGRGDVNGQDPRTVTPIEVYEFHHLAKKIFSDLEATWEPIIQMQIQDIELETNPDFMQITNASENCSLALLRGQ